MGVIYYKPVFERYQHVLERITPQELVDPTEMISPMDSKQQEKLLSQCAYMCRKAQEFEDVDVERCARWLGFVQGVLVLSDLRTMQHCHEDNLEIFEKRTLEKQV